MSTPSHPPDDGQDEILVDAGIGAKLALTVAPFGLAVVIYLFLRWLL